MAMTTPKTADLWRLLCANFRTAAVDISGLSPERQAEFAAVQEEGAFPPGSVGAIHDAVRRMDLIFALSWDGGGDTYTVLESADAPSEAGETP
jgi:hypothetical protein